jgi:hypothetical protein
MFNNNVNIAGQSASKFEIICSTNTFQSQMPEMNYPGKYHASDMLGITVWLGGEGTEITGIIEPGIVPVPCSIILPSPTDVFSVLPAKTGWREVSGEVRTKANAKRFSRTSTC